MNRWSLIIIATNLFLLGCSGGPSGSLEPLAPSPDEIPVQAQTNFNAHTQLWGFWEFMIDTENLTVEMISDRNAMFTANVTGFLNTTPPKLGININNINTQADYIDVDIDVSVTHPFPGLDQYNGYDVRGIFMGNGSATMNYNPDITYPVQGTDQYMFANPVSGSSEDGAPDGYTRWFNVSEFNEGGMPLFSYVQGDLATPGFNGTATICPFRYYADGLEENDNLFQFLTSTVNNGVFTAGNVNTRNYYLQFPNTPGVVYGYAVIASWEDVDIHPANAPEAQAVQVSVTNDIYYVDGTDNGGDLILDIDVFGWESDSGGPEDYDIIIESTVLSTSQEFDGGMIGTSGGDNVSTYHIEIPADNVPGTEDNEFWVIVECDNYDYTNDFGTPNLADTDPLAAFFRFDLYVSDIPYNTAPDVTGIEDVEDSGSYQQIVTISDIKTYWAIFTDPDSGQTHTFTWYIVDDGVGPPGPSDEVAMPIDWSVYGVGDYDIYVDVDDGIESTLGGPYDITVIDATGGVITFGGAGTEYPLGFAVDSTGAKYTGGYFFGQANLDPDGNDPHDQVGGGNMWLNKIDAAGDFVWGHSWPSMSGYHSYVWGIVVDDADNIYVVGHFNGTVDFDPGSGVDTHSASSGNGRLDGFLWKYDSAGNYTWGLSWGGSQDVTAFDIDIYNNTYLYITGYFFGTADIDPTSGTDYFTATASSGNVTDGYAIKVDLDGNYIWGKTLGAGGTTYGFDCAADNSGNLLLTGNFYETVDLDPGTAVDPHSAFSSGTYDAYVVKLDANGVYEWGLSFGGDSWDKVNAIVSDSSDNVYITGGYSSTYCDFDPGTGDETKYNQGSYDGFMCKFDPDGIFQWVKIFGEPGHDNTWAIMIDDSGNILMAGHFNGTMDLDPGAGDDIHTAHGSTSDNFVVKLTSDGDHIWGSSWGGTDYSSPDGMDIQDSGLINIAGKYRGTVDFNPGSGTEEDTSNGLYDVYINMLLPSSGEW